MPRGASLVPVERLPKDILPTGDVGVHGPRRARGLLLPARRRKLLNFVGIVETDEVSEESWTVKFPWERLKADYAGWHPIIQTIIDCADKDECYRWSLHQPRSRSMNWSDARASRCSAIPRIRRCPISRRAP